MTMTNEEIEAGIIKILRNHGLPVSTAATSQAREHAQRVARFYRSVAHELDALTAEESSETWDEYWVEIKTWRRTPSGRLLPCAPGDAANDDPPLGHVYGIVWTPGTEAAGERSRLAVAAKVDIAGRLALDSYGESHKSFDIIERVMAEARRRCRVLP